MKNIHLLPTDKPSRLLKTIPKGNLILSKLITSGSHWENQNIYIISDENTKVGEWALNMDIKILVKSPHAMYNNDYFKKIILTTDQDLINDGVQSIDDEFLEWFVKNPSCEKVEVQKWASLAECGYSYHIIIPQEEPKQIYYNTVGRENGVNVIKGQFKTQKEALDLANELNRKFPDLYYDWRETLIKEEPKQETLEEAAERLAKIHCDVRVNTNTTEFQIQQLIIKGAKWEQENSNVNALHFEIDALKRLVKVLEHQQERSYSEEEVYELLLKHQSAYRSAVRNTSPLDWSFDIKQWFEQFKKIMDFGTKGCMYCEGECNKECLTEKDKIKEAIEKLKGKELFKESNDRAKKILSEIKWKKK